MFLMIGQNGHTPFFWNLPIWQPDYAVFFGVLYLVLLALGVGLGLVFYQSRKDLQAAEAHDPDAQSSPASGAHQSCDCGHAD